jgi:hypothetical protein
VREGVVLFDILIFDMVIEILCDVLWNWVVVEGLVDRARGGGGGRALNLFRTIKLLVGNAF